MSEMIPIIIVLTVLYKILKAIIEKSLHKINNKKRNNNGDLIDKNKPLRPSDQSKSDEELATFALNKPLRPSDQSKSDEELATFALNTKESNITAPTKNQIETQGDKCWIPKGKSITVAGIKIDGGMIYVGSKLPQPKSTCGSTTYGKQDDCLINPRLKVSNSSDSYNDEEMSWYHDLSYKNISAQNRRKYLEWLADGAKNPDIDTGCILLYFYGLERRLFLDQSVEDSADISHEIKRLFSIYSSNHSVNHDLSEALFYADILIQKEQSKPTVKISDSRNLNMPLNIRFYLGKKLQNNPILDIDDLLIWFFNHPQKKFRTPVTRLGKEFIALMRVRLTEECPNGLKVTIPKKKIPHSYTASRYNFTINLYSFIGDIPDILNVNATIEKIQNIANNAMGELDKLSRLLARNPKAIGTFEALALLPPELIKEFGGDMVSEVQLWILEKHQSQSEITLLELVKKITDHSGAKITKAIYKEVEQVATSLGWNVIPAYNEIIGSIKPDMKILLLPQDNDGQAIESPSQEFLLALFELTLGAYVAHSDHHILLEEIGVLSKRIGVLSHLKKSEQNRLYLYIKWLAIQKVELLTLRSKLKNLNHDSKMAFVDTAISVANADGKNILQKVKVLETVYQAMGLDKKELFSKLHSMTKSGAHNSIDKTSKLLDEDVNPLNVECIASARHDTDKASTLLASIFEDDEIEPEPKKVNKNIDENAIYAGLDKVHEQLLSELLKKDEWPRDEYQKLASSLKLMPDGAIEIINEWAFEVYGEIIVDNDDPINIYKKLLNKGI